MLGIGGQLRKFDADAVRVGDVREDRLGGLTRVSETLAPRCLNMEVAAAMFST